MSSRTVSAMFVAVLAAGVLLAGTAASSLDLGEGALIGEDPGSRDIQETIWFQGFLADGVTGEPVNATYTVTARIYDAASGGSSVWGPESHVGTVITDGWFNIELGSVIGGLPAFDTPPYYLQLTVNGETLTPRLKLASVPSAFQSLGADNGLNLPYSGTWSGSGNAFQVTTTGSNICGYFIINNPGSTAGAVYGKHNGAGPAVVGYHTGSGPAIKGSANGTGLAGEFNGKVAVSDSILTQSSIVAEGTLQGRSLYVERTATVTGTLACNGIWMSRDPVAGYVLRCADEWGNAEWGPPNVIDRHVETGTIYLADGSVTQYDDTQVTLTVPGPGYIVTTSNVWFKFDHTSGTTDALYLANSESPTALPTYGYDRMYWEVPAGLPSSSSLDRSFTVTRTYEVTSAGTYTFYLVGQMTAGADGSDRFWCAQMTGIYYPYPIPLRSDSGPVFKPED